MKKPFYLFVASLVAILVLAGCVSDQNVSSSDSEGENNESGEDEKLTIAVVPKLVGIPYFNASEQGAIDAGEELGVEVIYKGPTEADAAQQVKVIEDLISQDVDVIAVAPNDPASLTPVLKKAKEEGIHVMDWDTPADKEVVELSVHQIDDEQYGRHVTDLLVENMGKEEGKIGLLTGGLSAANLNAWIEGAKMQAKEEYPGLEFVIDKIATDEKQQVAYQKTLNLIKSYPELEGIMAFSTPAPLGAAQAVQEQGMQDDISVVGTALPTDSKPFLDDGSLDVATLWEPDKLGFLTVYLAKQLAEGNEIEDGMEVPNIGEVEVWDDNKTVIMGPPTDFTKENAGDYDF
ncbi:autoinducer 2 ABC transporter substrate-binding protein [Thalassobacillus sp. CUG 92003]|uniref:autoinducer 2 ABC transporter substrate-binding protein n=1 Tax=Thalassobacillus sp. CUG 92003 TaxID=2736641 RepID=UPI0015E63FD5|nr:autoinducer 2 ABC transporter substrate-binding protein [Thalassobacillus sp. CUG 92003]